MALSDVHMGSSSFNKELFELHMELADEYNAYIFLLGDLWEMALPSHIEQAVWEQTVLTEPQYKMALKYLYPRRDRVIFSCTGNHDARVWKKTGIDLAKLFARELGCFYNNHGGYVQVIVGKQIYTFALFHGHSAAQNPYHELEKRFQVYDAADVIAMGNNHFLGEKLFVKKRIENGKETRKLVHLVRTGSFITEPDYSRASLYSPTPDGAPLFELSADSHKILVDAHGELRWQ